MKIKNSMIDKELKTIGIIIKIINNTFTIPKFRLINILMKNIRIRTKDCKIQVIEEWITRKDGSKMQTYIFKPNVSKENVPGILWLHGGGYAIGNPGQAKIWAKRFIEVSNCVVVAPDYRLSLESPYPAALEDSYEALKWIKNHAKELGIRDNQIMVGGDSAGGGLTAALTLYARDKKEINISFQMPLYPMLDDRMKSESAKENNAPVWNSKSNLNGWKLYLGNIFGNKNIPVYAAPARTTDYSKLPPAVTFVGELEPFRDETIQYVKNLRNAGVPVDFKVYKGCYHGFDQICPKAEISKNAISFVVNSFKNAVENYFAE
jgi:acetyl esterase/lipase